MNPVSVKSTATVPQGETFDPAAEGIRPDEVKMLRGLNRNKTVRVSDQMHVGKADRGGFYVVLETPGQLWVYRVGASERDRLAKLFRQRFSLRRWLARWYRAMIVAPHPGGNHG